MTIDADLLNALLNATAFEFFARYVLAGFIVFVIRNAYVVGERPKVAEVALDIVLFGLLSQLLASLCAGLALAALEPSANPARLALFEPGTKVRLFLDALLAPAVVGVVTGHALRFGWAKGVARAVALPVNDPIRRAYDHVFASRPAGYVILTFETGLQVYGWYGPNSRAGRDPGRSEIYLERIYSVDSVGTWTEMVPRRAALIVLAGLRSIEFLEET